jgi:hypothetical protein
MIAWLFGKLQIPPGKRQQGFCKRIIKKPAPISSYDGVKLYQALNAMALHDLAGDRSDTLKKIAQCHEADRLTPKQREAVHDCAAAIVKGTLTYWQVWRMEQVWRTVRAANIVMLDDVRSGKKGDETP